MRRILIGPGISIRAPVSRHASLKRNDGLDCGTSSPIRTFGVVRFEDFGGSAYLILLGDFFDILRDPAVTGGYVLAGDVASVKWQSTN